MKTARSLPALIALALVVLFVLMALLGSPPLAAVPAAAANPAITTVFPGALIGSASSAPGPADGLFTTLAGQATSSIDIAMYDFNRASIRNALLAAHARGVTVRVVGDGEDSANPSYAPSYNSLLAGGIAVITDTKTSLMHNKFAVFDQQVTWTGSANFTDTAFTFNAENIVVITDTVVAGIYRTEFAEMFAGKFSNDKTDNTAHSASVGGTAIEIAFAPTDNVEQRIINALNTANSSIQVTAFTFTNDALGNALIAADARGVQVEVLFDVVAAGSSGSERDRLCAAGVSVRVENFAARLHDKYAVVDAGTASDPLIITGSTNWTGNAVQANDENLLIAHEAGLAADYAAEFARIRSAITPGGFACNIGNAPPPTVAVYLPIIRHAEAPPSATPTATAQPAGQATISFILANPAETLAEYVQIQNTGVAQLDITSWTLRDSDNKIYTFPSFILGAGASVNVWTNSGTNTTTDLYWGRTQAVWNNAGDTAELRDAQGALISQYSYP